MKKCLLRFTDESAGLGDLIAMMPYVEKFRVSYEFDVYFQLKTDSYSTLFENSFPNIKFIGLNEVIQYDKLIPLKHEKHNKPLQQIFAEQLGFKNAPYLRPMVDVEIGERPIKNKYITFSTHSTSQLKFWNSSNNKKDNIFTPSWNELCVKLKKMGYTPVCIDYYESFGKPPFRNFVPTKSVRKLGMSLKDTINYIYHSEFFIGLSSGLSWLAHATGKRLCMISNFSEDWYEMDLNSDDYIRITNKNVCHGCWNNPSIEFNKIDFYWCPLHKDTDRQFECHTSITPNFVLEKIDKWIN